MLTQTSPNSVGPASTRARSLLRSEAVATTEPRVRNLRHSLIDHLDTDPLAESGDPIPGLLTIGFRFSNRSSPGVSKSGHLTMRAAPT